MHFCCEIYCHLLKEQIDEIEIGLAMEDKELAF
jgi:hypothetical protein